MCSSDLFLATQGITLANEATENQITAALHQLGEVVSIPNDPLTPADVQRGGQIQLVTRSRRLASRRQTRNL